MAWWLLCCSVAATSALRTLTELKAIYDASHARMEAIVSEHWNATGFTRVSSSPEALHRYRKGSIRWERAAAMAVFMDLCQPAVMLEIGGFVGFSSHFFLSLMQRWGGRMVSIDPNIPHREILKPREFYKRMNAPFVEAGRLHMIDAYWSNGESLGRQEPAMVHPQWFRSVNQTFDLAFIDGDHTEKGVTRDWELLRQIMRRGACVIFDDLADFYPGVVALVNKIQRSHVRALTGSVMFGFQAAAFLDNGHFSAPLQDGLFHRPHFKRPQLR